MSINHRISTTPCRVCGSAETIQVSVTLSGIPSSFTMCSVCEWKAWEHQGQEVPLASVLQLVAVR